MRLSNLPGSVRARFVSPTSPHFIRKERLPQGGPAKGHSKTVPDLVVEVVSPNDRYYKVNAKIEEFLAVGVPIVLVVDPEMKVVRLHRPDGVDRSLRMGESLDLGEIIFWGSPARLTRFLLKTSASFSLLRRNLFMTKRSWKPSLTTWIFVGLAVGIALGALAPYLKTPYVDKRHEIDIGAIVRPLSYLFLNLIKSIIAPLVFSTLVIGIAHTGDIKQVGRMGIKSLFYFEVVTTIALVVGLVAVNMAKPGVGVSLSVSAKEAPKKNNDQLTREAQAKAKQGQTDEAFAILAKVREAPDPPAKPPGLGDIIQHLAPASIFKAMAEGDVLQIVVFSILFALGATLVGERAKPMLDVHLNRWPRSCSSLPKLS